MGYAIRLGWVKAHMRLVWNKPTDAMAKGGCFESDCPHITEGGIRAQWKSDRRNKRYVVGAGLRRVVR